jgi:hypothetical protein
VDSFDLLALMAASLRASQGGLSNDPVVMNRAWTRALNEALYGLGVLQANSENLTRILAHMNAKAMAKANLVVSPTLSDIADSEGSAQH